MAQRLLTVTNTGKVAGADAGQVYVGEQNPKIPRPRYELKTFQKARLMLRDLIYSAWLQSKGAKAPDLPRNVALEPR